MYTVSCLPNAMLPKRITLLAPEGSAVFLLCLSAAIVFLIMEMWSVAFLAAGVMLLVGYLFRDPTRKIPPSPLGIVSPVDGCVLAIDSVHDPFADRPSQRIRLEINLTGVYTTRSPIEGKINKQWYNSPDVNVEKHQGRQRNGKYFAQWVQTDEGDNVVLSLTPRIKLQPHCRAHSGERIGQGQRCGFMLFGGQADVYVPVNSRIDVSINDHVSAGTSLLAALVRQH